MPKKTIEPSLLLQVDKLGKYGILNQPILSILTLRHEYHVQKLRTFS